MTTDTPTKSKLGTAVAKVAADGESRAPVPMGPRGVELTDMESAWRFSGYAHASGWAPKGFSREACFIAIQYGAELGLTPMAALGSLAVINGRPSIYGDAMLGIVRGTGDLEEFDEWFELKGQQLGNFPSVAKEIPDDLVAVCFIKRRGYRAQRSTFSVSEAKRAGLWAKEGPWTQYPQRMLKMRARAFGLRDQFADALRGISNAEEVRDLPVIDIGGTAEPALRPLFARPVEPPQSPAPPHPALEPDAQPEIGAVGPHSEPLQPLQVLKHGEGGKAAAAQEPEMTPGQSDLAQIVAGAGCDFDDLAQWVNQADWDDFSAYPTFTDLPIAKVQRLIKSKTGLVAALKKYKAGK